MATLPHGRWRQYKLNWGMGDWLDSGVMDMTTLHGDWTGLISFVSAALLSTFIFLFLLSSSVSLSNFYLSVPMRGCLGKHSCMSSRFPIAILNGTCSLRSLILFCGDVPAIKAKLNKQTEAWTRRRDCQDFGQLGPLNCFRPFCTWEWWLDNPESSIILGTEQEQVFLNPDPHLRRGRWLNYLCRVSCPMVNPLHALVWPLEKL